MRAGVSGGTPITLLILAMNLSPASTSRSAPTLETERLVLRHYRKSDFRAQFAIVGDDEVMRPLGTGALSAEDCWRRLAAVGRDVGPARLRRLGGRAQVGRYAGRNGQPVQRLARTGSRVRRAARDGLDFRKIGSRAGACGRGLPRGAGMGRRQSSSRRRSGRSFRRTMRRRSGWPSGSGSSGSATASITTSRSPCSSARRAKPQKAGIPVIARPRISAWTSCVPS